MLGIGSYTLFQSAMGRSESFNLEQVFGSVSVLWTHNLNMEGVENFWRLGKDIT